MQRQSLYLQKAKPVASCDESLLLPETPQGKAYASAPNTLSDARNDKTPQKTPQSRLFETKNLHF